MEDNERELFQSNCTKDNRREQPKHRQKINNNQVGFQKPSKSN